MENDPLELISIDPAVCHGQPCIRGTRVMVTVVLDALAAGLDTAEIVRHYPTLTPEGVRAAIAEERALVTFDLGFGDPRAYPPGDHQRRCLNVAVHLDSGGFAAEPGPRWTPVR